MRYSTGLTTGQVARLFRWVCDIVDEAAVPVNYPPFLGLFNSFVIALRYARTNHTQAEIAESRGISQPSVSRAVAGVTPVLAAALSEIVPVAEDLDANQTYIIDGSLLPCWSWTTHSELYSGKHKTTGFNVQVACDLNGTVTWVSDPVEGHQHDTAALHASGVLNGLSTALTLGDKGYQGTGMLTPIKKPIGGELTDHDREYNKQLNKLRAAVERAIAHLKNWKILHTDYRRPLATFKQSITVALGLYFFSTTE